MKSNAKADNKIEQEKVCDLCKALRTNTALSELLFSDANRTKSKIKAVSGRTLFYHLENSSFIWQLSKPVTKKRQALKLWLGSFGSTFSSKYDFAVLNYFGKHFLATVSLPFPPTSYCCKMLELKNWHFSRKLIEGLRKMVTRAGFSQILRGLLKKAGA